MKLIEAMNELKLTEKKLEQQLAFIQRYAARPSFRDDAFSGQEPKKVQEAVQSANDLIQRHEDLKRAIDYTNLVTKVNVGKSEHSIHSLILHKRFLLKLKGKVYACMNDNQAQQEVAQLRQRSTDQKVNAQVVYNFDVSIQNAKVMELMEMHSNIDSALQIANAKVELQEAPKL